MESQIFYSISIRLEARLAVYLYLFAFVQFMSQIPDEDLKNRRKGFRVDPLTNEIYTEDRYDPPVVAEEEQLEEEEDEDEVENGEEDDEEDDENESDKEEEVGIF